ncbi:hypothetical protein LMG6103_05843 [Achromobacter piechaudii]|nr:hypothetical protein LMG6103_05843 [Achromobacter piechaudii]
MPYQLRFFFRLGQLFQPVQMLLIASFRYLYGTIKHIHVATENSTHTSHRLTLQIDSLPTFNERHICLLLTNSLSKLRLR